MPRVTIDLESLGLTLTSGTQYRFDLDEDFIHDTTYKLPNIPNDTFALVEASVPKVHNITFGTGENIVLEVGVSNIEGRYFEEGYIATDYIQIEGGNIYLYDDSSTLLQTYLVPTDVLISEDKSKVILPATGLLSDTSTYHIEVEANMFRNLLGVNTSQEIDFVYDYPGTGTTLSANVSCAFTSDTFLSVIYGSRNYTFDLTGTQNYQEFGNAIAMNNEYIVTIDNADPSIKSSPLANDTMSIYSFDGSSNSLVDTIEVEDSNQTFNEIFVINGNASADAYVLSDTYLYSLKDNQLSMIQQITGTNYVGCSQTGIFGYVDSSDSITLKVYRDVNLSGLAGTVETVTLPQITQNPLVLVSNAFIVVADTSYSGIQSKIYVYDTTTLELVNNISTTSKVYFNKDTISLVGANFYYLTPSPSDINYINVLTGVEATLVSEYLRHTKSTDNLLIVTYISSGTDTLDVYRADNTLVSRITPTGLSAISEVAISETGYCYSLPDDNTNTGKITYVSF